MATIVYFLVTSVLLGLTTAQLDVLRYDVVEEVQVGQQIADIVEDSGLARRHSPDVLEDLHFKFLSQAQGNITIGSSNGILFTNGRLDREKICPRRNECEILLDIVVQPVAFFQIIKVAINIIDINDNQPMFEEPTFTLAILESAALDSTFRLPTAKDNDSPLFAIQRYELTHEDSTRSKFDLRMTTKLDGTLDVRLVLRRKLDRETRDRYNLKLVAYDGGLAPMSGTLNIQINVVDSNDNDPVFSETSYEVTVLENTARMTLVTQVHAEDVDDGVNGQVVYDFSSQTQSNYGHLFGIDGNNGEVYVKGDIDHEEASIYHLIVTAQDLGPDSLPADTTVVVHVQDVNDNAPQITINTLTAANTSVAKIAEDSPFGTFVAHLNVKDPDGGLNGAFNCSINNQNFTLEQKYATEYQITTQANLDREALSEYYVAVMCKDLGEPPQISIKHMRIDVMDINDNPPEFSSQLYTGSIIENNYVGALVLYVNATDNDIGKNAEISYSLSGKDAKAFEISSQGRIYAKEGLDRETQSKYVFTVTARDGGEPQLESSAHIEINVEDVNDESPNFTQISYAFSVGENLPAGEKIGSLAAQDKDSPPYNDHNFKLLPNRGNELDFILDEKSGLITTRRMLDCEALEVYHLTALVMDAHQPSMSSSAMITIYVRDTNDNPPHFIYPSMDNATVQISNFLPPGAKVIDIKAEDRDCQNNKLLTYSMNPAGNTDNMFSINPRNGTITVNHALVDIQYKVFSLEIQAKDKGMPAQSSTAMLKVIVNQAIPYNGGNSPSAKSGKLGHNFILVISLSCGCAIITVVLVLAIVCIRRKDRNKREQKYNCRMEALRMLTAKETLCHSEEGTPYTSPVNGKVNNGHCVMQYEKVPKEDPGGGTSPQRMPNRQYPGATHSCQQQGNRPWVLSHKEMEVHGLLGPRVVADDDDEGHHGDEADSEHSGDGSNTDSGKGPSEDGEKAHRIVHGNGVTIQRPATLGTGTHHTLPSRAAQSNKHPQRTLQHQGHSSKDQGHTPQQPPLKSCLKNHSTPSHSYSQAPTSLGSFGPVAKTVKSSGSSPHSSEENEPVWKLQQPPGGNSLTSYHDNSNYGSYRPSVGGASTLPSQRANQGPPSVHVTHAGYGKGNSPTKESGSAIQSVIV